MREETGGRCGAVSVRRSLDIGCDEPLVRPNGTSGGCGFTNAEGGRRSSDSFFSSADRRGVAGCTLNAAWSGCIGGACDPRDEPTTHFSRAASDHASGVVCEGRTAGSRVARVVVALPERRGETRGAEKGDAALSAIPLTRSERCRVTCASRDGLPSSLVRGSRRGAAERPNGSAAGTQSESVSDDHAKAEKARRREQAHEEAGNTSRQ